MSALLVAAVLLVAATGHATALVRSSQTTCLPGRTDDIVTVYQDGYGDGWVSGSVGTNLTVYSTSAVRAGTQTTMVGTTEAFGEFSLVSLTPICTESVLDMWAQGSFLSKTSIVLYSREYGAVSQAVPIFSAEPEAIIHSHVFNGTFRVQGPDAQNWFRISINLEAIKNDHLPPPTWDTIAIRDESGQGFSTFISSMQILPNVPVIKEQVQDCIGTVCNPNLAPDAIFGLIPSSVRPTLVPLFGFGPTAGFGEDRFLDDATGEGDLVSNALLVNGITNQEVMNFCASIQGMESADDVRSVMERSVEIRESRASRGQGTLGACFLNMVDVEVALEDPSGPSEWPIVSIVAFSYKNMTVIRKMAVGILEWMDKDGTVSQTADKITGASGPFVQGGDVSQASSDCPGLPWGLSRLDQAFLPLDTLYNASSNGSSVHVYVLDSGVSPHTDFGNRLGVGVNCVSGTCVLGNTLDDTGHGTHVAATVAGTCFGVAKGAIINPVKVFGPGGTGTYNSVIQGIQWAVRTTRINKWPAVINLSMSGTKSSPLNIAVKTATERGLTVVAASGNNYFTNACTKSPASSEFAISAASSSREDLASSFSNIGPCVSMWAPGEDIPSADAANLDGGWTVKSGTSMSAPHISGAAALYLECNNSATPLQVRDVLFNASVLKNLAPDTSKKLLTVLFEDKEGPLQ